MFRYGCWNVVPSAAAVGVVKCLLVSSLSFRGQFHRERYLRASRE